MCSVDDYMQSNPDFYVQSNPFIADAYESPLLGIAVRTGTGTLAGFNRGSALRQCIAVVRD